MSVLKVDTIQTTAGAAPTAKDLGFAAGSVIQVEQGIKTGQTSTGSSSYVDTGLSGVITPKFSSSKVLVLVSQPMMLSIATTDAREAYYNIVRGSTALIEGGTQFDLTHSAAYNSQGWVACLNFLDSPSTTSATTYKTQFRVSGGTSDIYAGYGGTSGTITLMEIAQ
tara:strand:- start:82 stop:582 length:501 start_codon:yes stop_codon:yes gene_type:complete